MQVVIMPDNNSDQPVSKMREVFINCQSGNHSQASLIKALLKVYAQAEEDKFFAEFAGHLQYFLIVFKREPAVERAIDFVAKFSTSLQNPGSIDAKDSAENDGKAALSNSVQEDMHPFMLKLFTFLLKNHNARDKAVRFRVCQLINRLFTSLGDDAAIDDDLYESVYTSMQCRLRDKFPIVRVHAVLALARLQDPTDPDCPVVAAFKYMLEYDVNADVRRAVLASIAATTRTVGVMIDRIRDVKDTVRRQTFQVVAEKVHVRALTIAQRVRMLRQGLNDRNESVKESCVTHLVKSWLNTYNGDKLALIGVLDVENSLDVCQQLLEVLFKKSGPEELTSKLDFLSDEHVLKSNRVTCETAVYWRCLCEYMRSLGSSADEHIDKVVPSGVCFAKFMQGFVKHANTEDRIDEQLKNEFILQQLVGIVATLDLSDEVNRKHIIQVLHDMLLSDCITHSTVSCILSRYSQLHVDSDAFVALIAEVISDIREPICLQQQNVGSEEKRQAELKLAAVRVQLNQLRDELDECIKCQDFQKAAELKQKVTDLEVSRQSLIEASQPTNIEVRSEKTDPQTLLKCLSLVSEMLTEVRFKKLTPSLQTMIEVLILPGIQNADPAVRNQAVKAIGLCCLRSIDLARERLVLLLQVSRMDQETVKVTALRAIFDLLHFFGLEAFKIEEETVKNNEPVDEGEISQTGVNDTSSDDFEDLSSDNASQPPKAEKTDIGADVLTILADLLDSSSSDVRTVCAEGFVKLLLAGRVVSPSLLSRLLLLWYNPLTEDDTRLRHCIGTFLPVYAFASSRNQQLIADAIMPTLHALFEAPATSPLSEVNVGNVADLLVELTDAHHQMAAGQIKNSIADKDQSPHDEIALTVANEILSNPNSFDSRVLVKTLTSLRVTPTNESILKDLKVLCRRMLKEVKDKTCVRLLEKFTRNVRDMLQKLKSENGASAGLNLSIAESEDDSFIDGVKASQNAECDATSLFARTLDTSASNKTTEKPQQKALKKLMSHSRLSPGDENCSISEFDTENDDLFQSPQPRQPRRAAAASSVLKSRSVVESPAESIDSDSDFEIQPAKPAQSRRGRGRAAKPAATPTVQETPKTRSSVAKRKHSPLAERFH